ncbi:large subunit GTPase 1 [Sporothrix schenckii 1099-18]|uniref:CP-type G domain-containing protein n=2 Tax=Sporothrix schenckii TaxID=29908 RepID=U7PJC4_SPOS1|nr:large subunit GTPase 1 [Sporothrix schenckii 1099-18]ERS95748.1 hypothetical protein HMPREF1624_07823 [Sporothrix schenckii ATCC 58251]KJR83766.1 large subunit GTPase 1 [Sporothrix schenckii 1099-18]
MGMPKSKKQVGLGNALMNDRFGNGKGKDQYRTGITRKNHATGEDYITNDRADAAWVKMRSITEQGAIEEFLSTAAYADTNFRAVKMNNSQIIHTDQKNPYLLTDAEEGRRLKLHSQNRERLTVPRRPHWDANMTAAELDKAERESFLVWRRGLAELQQNADLLMTPFERNLEVWRQLWRVIERSDLVVQIVDARNPLVFRSEDLEDYVKAVDPAKQNLLLINKADMMTDRQRRAWASHLTENKIAYKFFSAHMAKEQNELRQAEEEEEERWQAAGGGSAKPPAAAPEKGEDEEEDEDESEDDKEASQDNNGGLDTRILSVDELEALFLKHAPKTDDPTRKLKVGLVGYPNVGKSSTINALIGAKKVSVSSTPGKTKHFQTIELSPRVTLCDCPGLVFPNFATTKADLVCNGILPIDQLREFTGPAQLVTARIPKAFLEAVYGIHIRTQNVSEGGTGTPTAEELLSAYARARGFTRTGQGQPDESRAARYILKDYVNGKLLFVAPPPGHGIDPADFNHELYDHKHLPEKRQIAMAAAAAADTESRTSSKSKASAVPSLKRPSKKAAKRAGPNAWELEEEEEDSSDITSDEDEDEDEEGEESEGDEATDGEPMDDVVMTLPVREKQSTKSRDLDKAFFRESATGNRGVVARPFSYKYTEQGQAEQATLAAQGGATLSGKKLTGRKARTMDALAKGLDAEDARAAAKIAADSKKHFKGGQRGKGKKKMPSNAIEAWGEDR